MTKLIVAFRNSEPKMRVRHAPCNSAAQAINF
jgi:hypothetical protein